MRAKLTIRQESDVAESQGIGFSITDDSGLLVRDAVHIRDDSPETVIKSLRKLAEMMEKRLEDLPA